MHGNTTNGCVQDTLFVRVKADVKLETRATGEVQEKITTSPAARDSPSTPALWLPGNHEKIAPVLQTTHETTACFPAFSFCGRQEEPAIPNLLIVITHASHVCSQHSFGLSLRMNGMRRTQFDHARLDLLSLVF